MIQRILSEFPHVLTFFTHGSCTFLLLFRNEAPYLREWIGTYCVIRRNDSLFAAREIWKTHARILAVDLSSAEYHKMIGFETFLLFNDRSTDGTQCILDGYAERGIVLRLPQDFVKTGSETTTSTRPREQYSTFQACQEFLTQSLTREKASQTWMATHDVDEFLWFDQSARSITTSSSSSSSSPPLKQVISNLLFQIPSQHQQQGGNLKHTPAMTNVRSLVIPRLLFGSSGHDHYASDLVMNRITRRFDAGSCPYFSSSSNNQTSIYAPSRRRRLFNHTQPTSYCLSQTTKNRNKTSASFDDFKSMSRVSSLATKCHKINRETNETELAYCHGPHVHQLQHSHDDISCGTSNTTMTTSHSTLRNATRTFRNDARYLGPNQVYPFIALVHYRSKSRAEFYERTCDSRFSGKYFECPDCTPESYFNLIESFANLLEDHRMHDFAIQLAVVMNGSNNVASTQHCHVEPPSTHKSWDDYRSCFQKQRNAMSSSLANDTFRR
jgi:Glycosyl transferase family 2